MAGSYYNNSKDTTEISELAALNEEISEDIIEELSQKVNKKSINFKNGKYDSETNENDDSTLFEETEQVPQEQKNTEDAGLEEDAEKTITPENKAEEQPQVENKIQEENNTSGINLDDDFSKKFKAKLNQNQENVQNTENEENETETEDEKIENITKGNISERPLTKELKEYNDSLDFLDGNVKYSKYVIYIDPQNVNFIEGLTVKERKNLINSILRQQDDIAITKHRFKVIQTIIRHIIITILTLAISIPIVYYAINASLEATIDNHRRSQTNWQTLYKDNGKISQQ